MGKSLQLDNLFASIAGETGNGIEGLLDAFFGFLGRRTDFYHHDVAEARRVVFDAFDRHCVKSLDVKREEARPSDNPLVEDVTEDFDKEEKVSFTSVAGATREVEKISEKEEIPEGNGGMTDKYRWTQTLTQTEIFIPTKKGTRGKECKVNIQPKKLTVTISNKTIIDGELHSAVLPDDSLWTVEDEGSVVHVTLEKTTSTTPEWWAYVIAGDPSIDTQKIVPEPSKLSDLDPELRSTVEKMMFDQEMKQRGLPTSDQQKHSRMLEEFQRQHPEYDFSNAKITYPSA